MDEMAIHGSGTYDHNSKKWKIRTKELSASITLRQLEKRYGIRLPNDERKTRPYWLQYLKELRQQNALESADLRKLTAAISNRPPGAYSEQDPIPDELVPIINAASQGNIPELKARVIKDIPKKESLKIEADQYVARYKKKNNKQWYDVQRAIKLFLEATGDIRLQDIDVHQYRRFLEILDREQSENKWSQRTKQNRQRIIHTFLKQIEADHNLSFSFIRNKAYQIATPRVQQTKYTLEQVKLALAKSKGIARTGLLLGLNCGFYWSDIAELTPEHFDGTHITKGRAKNKRNGVEIGFISKWKLWPETIESLAFRLTRLELQREYMKLRKAYDLPEHMALRKTVAQWIQEVSGEEESRVLYRAEGFEWMEPKCGPAFRST